GNAILIETARDDAFDPFIRQRKAEIGTDAGDDLSGGGQADEVFDVSVQKWFAPIKEVDKKEVIAELPEQLLKHGQSSVPLFAVLHLKSGGTERASKLANIGRVERNLERPGLDVGWAKQQLPVGPQPVEIGFRMLQPRAHQCYLFVPRAESGKRPGLSGDRGFMR